MIRLRQFSELRRATLARWAVAAAMMFSVATLAPAPAAAQATFSDQQKAQIGEIVKDYLMKNPEVIAEALTELEKKQKEAEKTAARAGLKQVQATLLNSPRNIVLGNPQGDVTLVEFLDYNCPYCKRALVDVRDLIKGDPKLRVIIRDFPVLGPDSVEASVVAVAARNQIKPDRYFEFHQKLMESKGRVGKDRAMALAKEFGVDQAKLSKDMESPDTRAAIQETMEIGDTLKLQGTPAFVIGDEVVFGAVGVEPLKQAVSSVRQCGRASC